VTISGKSDNVANHIQGGRRNTRASWKTITRWLLSVDLVDKRQHKARVVAKHLSPLAHCLTNRSVIQVTKSDRLTNRLLYASSVERVRRPKASDYREWPEAGQYRRRPPISPQPSRSHRGRVKSRNVATENPHFPENATWEYRDYPHTPRRPRFS